jgi:hypothetical protein
MEFGRLLHRAVEWRVDNLYVVIKLCAVVYEAHCILLLEA